MKRHTRKPRRKVTFETARKFALALPHVKESPSYGTPGFKVKGKLFARFHQDGESLVVRIEEKSRATRMQSDPQTFYITDHYVNYPWMLVRIASVQLDDLQSLLADAWRQAAPRSLLTS